jgi:predicted  nucleic acid-binding Zn-ribbon protein
VLQVENELSRLREQIESTEERLRYLKDQVSLSTLTITFYQTLDNEHSFEFLMK